MANVKNPRHPHTCRIYRRVGETSFEDGVEEVLYEGACRKYGNTSLRSFTGGDRVKYADYALSLPGQVRGVGTGTFVDVTDLVGTVTGAVVTDSYPTNLGTTVYFNLPKN